MLRLPPSSFKCSELFSIRGWLKAGAPHSVLVSTVSASWRMATKTLAGWWEGWLAKHEEDILQHGTVVQHATGRWTAPCWAQERNVAQQYGEWTGKALSIVRPRPAAHVVSRATLANVERECEERDGYRKARAGLQSRFSSAQSSLLFPDRSTSSSFVGAPFGCLDPSLPMRR